MDEQTNLSRKLFAGSLDIVGDIHGDIDGLQKLLNHLEYDAAGNHPAGRKLVFVGDLVDRGPDSPAVVQLVRNLVKAERAQCVLGNHELNIMLSLRKFDNGWFYAEEFIDSKSGLVVPQVLADDDIRAETLKFFNSLPLALEREDVRVIHACWQPEMVSMISNANDVVEYFNQHQFNINLGLAIRADLEDWQREQRHQNLNPVKVLTSGLEVKTDKPFESSGKIRNLERFPWWDSYQEEAYCFFGHYSQPYPRKGTSKTRAFCVDFGVARRWVPKQAGDDDPMKWRLAAIRYPELEVVFDNGDRKSLELNN